MKNARAALALAALTAVPALALAQQAASSPKLEFGMDLSLQYSKPSGHDGYFHVGAPTEMAETGMVSPVVFRLGFVSQRPMSLEIRFAGGLFSSSGSGGNTFYSVAPGLNLIRRLSGKNANDHTYLTAGGSADLFGISGGSSSDTWVFVTFNAGLGMVRPWGAGAKRAEVYVAYTLENSSAGTPNILHFGLRLGASLFH